VFVERNADGGRRQKLSILNHGLGRILHSTKQVIWTLSYSYVESKGRFLANPGNAFNKAAHNTTFP
jgi:hypothetical protein